MSFFVTTMVCGFSLYQILAFFLIYSCLGWWLEAVSYTHLVHRHILPDDAVGGSLGRFQLLGGDGDVRVLSLIHISLESFNQPLFIMMEPKVIG